MSPIRQILRNSCNQVSQSSMRRFNRMWSVTRSVGWSERGSVNSAWVERVARCRCTWRSTSPSANLSTRLRRRTTMDSATAATRRSSTGMLQTAAEVPLLKTYSTGLYSYSWCSYVCDLKFCWPPHWRRKNWIARHIFCGRFRGDLLTPTQHHCVCHLSVDLRAMDRPAHSSRVFRMPHVQPDHTTLHCSERGVRVLRRWKHCRRKWVRHSAPWRIRWTKRYTASSPSSGLCRDYRTVSFFHTAIVVQRESSISKGLYSSFLIIKWKLS